MAQTLFFNGIDAESGKYVTAPMDSANFARRIRCATPRAEAAPLQQIVGYRGVPAYSPPDVSSPEKMGWGIIFHSSESTAVRQACAPLMKHRSKKCGQKRVAVLDYDGQESITAWLRRRNAVFGSPDHDRMPLYLLIIGSPAKISYSFQYLLDVDYFVGRLSFDRPDDYRAYVESVIKYEEGKPKDIKTRRSAAFFAPQHPGDDATELSFSQLVEPLVKGRKEAGKNKKPIAATCTYGQIVHCGDNATKVNLQRLFHDPKAGRPSLIFTASHGLGWSKGHRQQLARQGALICQEWPGRNHAAKPSHYFSGEDISGDACLSGVVGFHFACYGAGTPEFDEFPTAGTQKPESLTADPFVAKLPQKMLAHAKGGALAFLGHVERAWSCSIPQLPDGTSNIETFRGALTRILLGKPVGFAKKPFPELFKAQSARLNGLLRQVYQGDSVDDHELVQAWVETHDARNYSLLGDPAVRLRPQDLLESLKVK